MGSTRRRTVEDTYALQEAIENYRTDGYTVVSEDDTEAELKYKDSGSLLAHLVLFFTIGFWTLGLANLAYVWHRRRKTADRIIITVADGGGTSGATVVR